MFKILFPLFLFFIVVHSSIGKNDKTHTPKEPKEYTPYQKSETDITIDEVFYTSFLDSSKKVETGTYFDYEPWPKGRNYSSKYFDIGPQYLAFVVVHDPDQPEETDAVVKSIALYVTTKGKKGPAADLNLYLKGYSEGTHHDLRAEIKDLNNDKVPEVIQFDYSYEFNETSPSKPKIKVFSWRKNKYVEAKELIEKVTL